MTGEHCQHWATFHTVNTRQKLGKRRRIFDVGNVYTREKYLLPPPYYYHKRLIAEVAVADKSVFRVLLVKLNWDKINHSALFFFNDCEKKHLQHLVETLFYVMSSQKSNLSILRERRSPKWQPVGQSTTEGTEWFSQMYHTSTSQYTEGLVRCLAQSGIS